MNTKTMIRQYVIWEVR